MPDPVFAFLCLVGVILAVGIGYVLGLRAARRQIEAETEKVDPMSFFRRAQAIQVRMSKVKSRAELRLPLGGREGRETPSLGAPRRRRGGAVLVPPPSAPPRALGRNLPVNSGDVLIDTLMLCPDGHYHARVLQRHGEPHWERVPENVAQRILGELERTLRELPAATSR